MTKRWRDVLQIHPAAELFPLMTPDELRVLGEDIKKNGLTSPIVLWRSHPQAPAQLLDGRNRLDAIEIATGSPVEVGAPSITAGDFLACDKVIVLDKSVDPWAYVVSANVHRRHLTIEDKDRVIVQLLKADPTKSNRRVAKLAETSHPHVAKVREHAEKAGDVETVTTSVDTKGRKQLARKKPVVVDEQRREARGLKQERAEAAARARKEREEWRADISRFAYKLIRLDLDLARELHRLLVGDGGDSMQLMDDLAAGIAIEEASADTAPPDDDLDIPTSLRRAPR